jgi:hypothetical protein
LDPITIAIIAAVSAGVTSGAAKEATIDAYKAIKNAVRSKFGKESKVSKAIAALEEDPDSKGQQLILSEQMAAVGVTKDPDLVFIAERLVKALCETEEGRIALAKFQIELKDAQVGVIGDKAHIEGGIHFGDTKK